MKMCIFLMACILQKRRPKMKKKDMMGIILFLVLVFAAGIGTQAFAKNVKGRSYKITYKLDKGTNNKRNPAKYKSDKTTRLYPPVRRGYVFKGWYSDPKYKNRIRKIKRGTKGAITIYALWQLEPLNVNKKGSADMIWSWWYYPQAITYEGKQKKLYWGFASGKGYCGVASYNYADKAVEKTYLKKSTSVDDHNGLALTVMPDGRIMCVYAGGHNVDRDIYVRISDKPENIHEFSTNTVLRSSGKTCYSQILQYNGKYYLFYRMDNKKWAYRVSSDGLKWTDEVILITSPMQYYCKFMPTTKKGIIRVCMYSNPAGGDTSIRMGFFNLNTGKLYDADNRTKLGTKKISYRKFSVIISKPKDLTQRMFDVAITEPGKPRILYAVFSSSKTSKASTYKLYDAGKVIDICQGGEPLWNPKYQLGASFVADGEIVLARNRSGCDMVERYRYSKGKIKFVKLVYTEKTGNNHTRNARPIADVNGKAFLWHRGYYNPDSYKDFNTEAKLYFMP